MVDRYTIEFGPAVSQKELEKALINPTIHEKVRLSKRMHEIEARIEIIAELDDLKKISAPLKSLSIPSPLGH